MAHLVLGDILADARSPPADRRQALEEYARTIKFAEQAKDPRRVGWALYKSSELHREERHFPEAIEMAERAGHILGQVGDQVGLAVSVRARGRIAMDQGDLDRAEVDLLEALRLLRGTNNTLEEIDAILRLGQLASSRGDQDGARQRLAELVRMNLPQVRPDLREEFDSLEHALADGSSSRKVSPA